MNARRPTASADKTIIGWREYIALPEWEIDWIQIKADTGARTSAIDVTQIEELPNERVRFNAVVRRGESPSFIRVEADIVRRTRIKSSFGAAHDRLVVRTRVRLGGVEKDVDLSLVSRKNMLVRVLLGRHALEPEFVVDPGRRYVFGRRKHVPARPRKGTR
jgi:hypothetical protein